MTATPAPRPAIVCLCGSTRFWQQLAEANLRETLAGRIVVAPGVDMKRPHPAWSDPQTADRIKRDLDALHRAKIDLADEVLVVAPGGYIGESTRAEIAYAQSLGKPVRYTADPDKPQPGPDRIADAIAHLQADTSHGGMIARFGDRMADLHRASTQAADEQHRADASEAGT